MAAETKGVFKFSKMKVDTKLERGINYLLAIAIDNINTSAANNCVRSMIS